MKSFVIHFKKFEHFLTLELHPKNSFNFFCLVAFFFPTTSEKKNVSIKKDASTILVFSQTNCDNRLHCHARVAAGLRLQFFDSHAQRNASVEHGKQCVRLDSFHCVCCPVFGYGCVNLQDARVIPAESILYIHERGIRMMHKTGFTTKFFFDFLLCIVIFVHTLPKRHIFFSTHLSVHCQQW